MDIDHLNKMLATVEVAKYLYNLDEGKTLDKITAMAKAINDGTDDENDNEVSPNPFADKPIKLFRNSSPLSFNGKVIRRNTNPDAPGKRLPDIANNVGKARNLAQESDELGWIDNSPMKPSRSSGRVTATAKPKLTDAELKSRKDAILKSHEDRKAVVEAYALTHNQSAASILKKKLAEGALHVETEKLTPAQVSIVAKPSNAEGSRKIVDADMPALRLKDNFPVDQYMPEEFRKKPKIEASKDMSFVAQTKAARTLARSKPTFKSNEMNDQGDAEYNKTFAKIPNIEPPVEDGKSMAGDTYKAQPNQQKQWDVSLPKPKKGNDYFNGKTDNIGV